MKLKNPYDPNKEPASHYWWEESQKPDTGLTKKRHIEIKSSEQLDISFVDAQDSILVCISGYQLKKAVKEYLDKATMYEIPHPKT